MKRPVATRCVLLVLASVCAASPGWTQNLLPNPGFEEGSGQPSAWRLFDGAGEWSMNAQQGTHCIVVEGDGNDQSVWRTERMKFVPGGLYRLKFQARRESGSGGGTAVSGTSRVNRDFRLDDQWQEHSFVFAVPADVSSDSIRLGQWHVKGRCAFDEAELAPAMPVHAQFDGGLELGEAESIRAGVYRFKPNFGWTGANFHRPLVTNRAGFNSDRWLFAPGAAIVYRFSVPGHEQKGARVRANINYFIGGALRVEASRDGKTWLTVTNYDGEHRAGVAALPAELFPAPEIFIRLAQPEPGSGFQVNAFEYEAPLIDPPPDAEGATHFLNVLYHGPQLAVQWQGMRRSERPGRWRLDFALTNLTAAPLSVRGSAWLDSDSAPAFIERESSQLKDHGHLSLTCPVGPTGTHLLNVLFEDDSGRALFAGQVEVRTGFLDDPRPGHWLAQTKQLGVWWCESGWKIGRERGLPEKPPGGHLEPVRLSAARGEYEPVQVVLRPEENGQLLSVKAGLLRNERDESAGITAAVNEVAYVNVTHPTDDTCLRGWYPDPLPPLRTPFALRAGQNQPLWITFHVPRAAPAGDYRGELELRTSSGTTRIPVEVHVYDFALPEQTHLKSAFGLGTGAINHYHRLTTPGDKQAVFEKYLKNFAEHRIGPYSFFDYAPIEIRFVGAGAEKHAQIDFSKFDEAASKWLDEYHFNAFRLPLRGMGGGTFHSRHLGALEGFEEGTPEHARLFQDYLSQVERHLRERGWLDEAFAYWFDEPDRKDYEFVVAGMDRIKAAAPGLRRMLTEQPERELIGHVDIWCGLTPEWTPEKVRARRDAGEEVWWYICTGPKAPYVTEFIDHPGTELRLWPWQSWQYGVEGILVWATLYWNSPAAFPSPQLQDPWEDPMSYVSGYDFGPGHIGYWGNGDGRFLYPPRRDPETSRDPNLDEPVNSLRWEQLRDGMEDYEYFWLLREAIKGAPGNQVELLKEARALLSVPANVSKDLTHFTDDPRPMLEHRDRVARMIERLR